MMTYSDIHPYKTLRRVLALVLTLMCALVTLISATSLDTTRVCIGLGYNLSLVGDLQECNEYLGELYNDTVIINNTLVQYVNTTVNNTIILNNTEFINRTDLTVINTTLEQVFYYENITRYAEFEQKCTYWANDSLAAMQERHRHDEEMAKISPQQLNNTIDENKIREICQIEAVRIIDTRNITTTQPQINRYTNNSFLYISLAVGAIIILLLFKNEVKNLFKNTQQANTTAYSAKDRRDAESLSVEAIKEQLRQEAKEKDETKNE